MPDLSDSLTCTSITIPKDLKHKARVVAAVRDTNLSTVIQNLLMGWIEENAELLRPFDEALTK
jgi:hypothetical protein